MPDLYTDADVQAAVRAITVARGLNPDVVNAYRDAAQGDWARAILAAVAPAIAAKTLRTYAADLEDNPSADDWDRKHEFVSDVRVYANDVEKGLIP